ncbi:MAG: prepilin-type N-terminal cleavage/methylation domain-containing protein [Proteobacteria bacterium]|nr:prepilin-type N-terminal cleavage/methylation domain-containing protein [Pseudomonadota bacterium]
MTSNSYGFTLLELAIVIAVVGMLLLVTGPSIKSLSQTLEYREAVRELVSANQNARRTARASGSAVDLIIDASQNRFVVTGKPERLEPDNFTSLSDVLKIEVVFAQEVSPGNGLAAIRFYPEGGASGGEVLIQRPSGGGVKLTVDWLIGDVRQEPL